LIGNFYRPGKLYTRARVETLDHDFPSLASGVVIPHGIYDLKQKHGYVTLGTSHDTSEFAGDCLRGWWRPYGQAAYPQASSILILCDGGGSNRARGDLFKLALSRFARVTGREVRVAHYPPYTSKYNPIEHRLFPHLERACQGMIFIHLDLVQELMAKANTKTGLTVSVTVSDKVYKTGLKVPADVKEQIKIIRDENLPQWNYRILP